MKVSLTKEAMSYKKQIKENELITKLRIVKLIKVGGHNKTTVAEKFSCCRKTIYNIVKSFETELDKNSQKALLTRGDFDKKALEKMLEPIRNKSQAPHSHSRTATEKQADHIEELIKEKGVSASPGGLQRRFQKRYDLDNPCNGDLTDFEISLAQLTRAKIKGVIKRRELKKDKQKTASGKRQPLYNYQAVSAFSNLHLDTKHLADKKAVSLEIHDKILNNRYFPEYEYNIIDVKTRTRFMSFSNHLYSEFGLRYLVFVIMFIRAKFNNWDTHITIWLDNGSEFCSGSKRKENKWNKILKPLNAHIVSYHRGHDVRKNLIETSHRPDDSEFLRPRGDLINSKKDFLAEATYWWTEWNFRRPHTGIGMNNRTPYEVLKDSGLIGTKHLIEFPILFLEDDIHLLRRTTDRLICRAEIEKLNNENGDQKLDQKTLDKVRSKYSFFDQSGENVLTNYPI